MKIYTTCSENYINILEEKEDLKIIKISENNFPDDCDPFILITSNKELIPSENNNPVFKYIIIFISNDEIEDKPRNIFILKESKLQNHLPGVIQFAIGVLKEKNSQPEYVREILYEKEKSDLKSDYLSKTNESLEIANEELRVLNEQLHHSYEELELSRDALEISEKKYSDLFYNMIDAYALHEIILDSNNNPIDYKFIDINPEFEKMTGLTRQIIGRTVLEILPETEYYWIETYGKVAMTGEPARFENYSQAMGKWFDVKAYKSGENRFAVIFEDITTTKEASIELQKKQTILENSLNEKETLLKEVHHRVKNNMQIISSLLHLQSQSLENENDRKLFLESQNRIRAMALVHEKIYQSENLNEIKFSDYITNLMNYYKSNFETSYKIKTSIHCDDTVLDIDIAIPLALITNEIITNSFKYAFNNDKTGTIEIHFKNENNHISYTISDNGPGFPEDFIEKKSNKLGSQLIFSLIKQINGEINIFNDNGAHAEITFKL